MPSNLVKVSNLTYSQMKKELAKYPLYKNGPMAWVEASWDPSTGLIRYAVVTVKEKDDHPS